MVHGDDKGLILPPKIAPYQVVIIPIFYEESEKKKVIKKAKDILKKLKENEIRAIVDERMQYTPGWKFNYWELKGVPLRIEIGPKDLKSKRITIARRDNFERTSVKEKEIVKKVKLLLEDIQKNLFRKAKKFLKENTTTVKDYDEFKKILKNKGGFIKASWCGSKHCEEQIKIETGATIRAIPIKKEKVFSSCIYCGKKGDCIAYFAKAY